jgi:hypothetical protein
MEISVRLQDGSHPLVKHPFIIYPSFITYTLFTSIFLFIYLIVYIVVNILLLTLDLPSFYFTGDEGVATLEGGTWSMRSRTLQSNPYLILSHLISSYLIFISSHSRSLRSRLFVDDQIYHLCTHHPALSEHRYPLRTASLSV